MSTKPEVGPRNSQVGIESARGSTPDRRADGSTSRRSFLAASVAGLPIAGALAQGGNAKHPLKVVMVGMQGHTRYIMEGITQLDDCKLVGVARSTPDEKIERLRSFKSWNDETKVYDDYRKMLDELKPDVVGVFMPYAQNSDVYIEAARRGCHSMGDKPLAVELEALDTLKREQKRTGALVSCILSYRMSPHFAAARKLVVDGMIGEPLLISAQKSYRFGNSRAWFYKERETYGGTIPWVAIHAIDFIRYVSGLEYANVTARHANKVQKGYPGCEDCGAILFEMTNGGQTTLTFDYLRPKEADSHGDDRLRVAGSKGVLEVRTAGEAYCEVVTNDAPLKRVDPPPAGPNIFVDYVNAIRSGKPPMLTVEDVFRTAEVAIKARNAADTKTTIEL